MLAGRCHVGCLGRCIWLSISIPEWHNKIGVRTVMGAGEFAVFTAHADFLHLLVPRGGERRGHAKERKKGDGHWTVTARLRWTLWCNGRLAWENRVSQLAI